jgi:glycosyltransferase involved in cell wall biosynthesis
VYAAALHRQQPRLLEQADALVTVSEACATKLYELGVPDDRITVLPNFVRAQDAPHPPPGEFALVAGRLVEEKGFDTAIAAAAEAGVPLTIAGTGPDEPRLRKMAGETVTFTGRLTPKQLGELRSRAVVALAPSRWEEPCPYAVLDALAAGVPALVSDRGGLPELVSSEEVLPAEDQAAWAEAVRALWRDPQLQRARGEKAIRRARERFGEEAYLKGLLRIYE